MSLTQQREALAAAVPSGFNSHAFPPASVTAPAAIVTRGPIDPVIAQGNNGDWFDVEFTITFLFPLGIMERAAETADAFADPSVLVAAVQSDQTLDGSAHSVQVTQVSAEGLQSYAGETYASFSLTVQVME